MLARRCAMSSRAVKGFAFVAFMIVLAAVALILSNYPYSSPDNRGIGGDWNPGALATQLESDDYSNINNDEGLHEITIVLSDQKLVIPLDESPDGLRIRISPLSSYMPEGPFVYETLD